MLDVVRGVEVYLSKYTGHKEEAISDSRFPNCEWLGGEWGEGEVLYVGRAVSYTHLTLPTICSV